MQSSQVTTHLPIKLALALTLLLSIVSCKTSKQVEVVERVKTDTLYQSNIQYDSIYITQNHYVDRSKDTVYINDKTTEFRYKLLRDTIYKSRIDSIPVIREVKGTCAEHSRSIPWYCKWLAWIGAISLLLLILYITIKLTKHFA